MDAASIEKEIRRLSPWYYRLDLGGVSTDITPPCDPGGHREIFCPPIFPGFWREKTVLDCGCNEGVWSFGALGHGAAHADAFDCREINIEKARFAARVLGQENVDFHVESCDSWFDKHAEKSYDVVFMCGLLYHLTDPGRTIRDFCSIADEWVYVVSLIHGGEDGYTSYTEPDTVAASDRALDSLMPNTPHTLIDDFAKHGFVPAQVEETREGHFGGGCCLLLRNCGAWKHCIVDDGAGDFDAYLVPVDLPDPSDQERPFNFLFAVYNRSRRARVVDASLFQRDGHELRCVHGPVRLSLPARTSSKGDPPSQSVPTLARVEAAGSQALELQLRDPEDGTVLSRSTLDAQRR